MKISVITVSYNSASHIEKCVSSVNCQDYDNIEHIIIDGASNDNTLDIISNTPNRISRIISEPDNGIYDAMNKGINIATGEVIGFLNSDDVFYSKTVLSKISTAFCETSTDCIYGDLVFTNSNGDIKRIWKSKDFKQGLFEKSWTPAHPTFYCKSKLYKEYGLYKTNYKIAADVELMLRFLEIHKVHYHYINEFLVNMLVGGVSNRGLKSTHIITKEMKRAFKENNLSFNIVKYLFYKLLKISELLTSRK